MSYEDFIRNFTDIEVCHLGLESLELDDQVRGKRRLEEVIYVGSWIKSLSAGGCANFAQTFPSNPQFMIEVTDPDPDDHENFCNIIVGLMQKNVRRNTGGHFNVIGFAVYAIPGNHQGRLNRPFLQCNTPKKFSKFTNTREITERLKLPPGKYVIIPSTFEPNQEADFILRVITQRALKHRELDNGNKTKAPPEEIQKSAQLDAVLQQKEQWMKNKFNVLCDPEIGAINSIQLKRLLNDYLHEEDPELSTVSLEVCRSILSSMDANHTGLMELEELKEFWFSFNDWKHAFLNNDVNHNKELSVNELRDALSSAGFDVSNLVFAPLVHRYTHPETGSVSFADFILCCVRLKAAFDVYEAQPKNFSEQAVFREEDFIRLTCYM